MTEEVQFQVNEHFVGIQGEGRFAGSPVLFIRLSGCTRECDWCDTLYHNNGEAMSISDVAKIIDESGLSDVVLTGGEPLMQIAAIEALTNSYLFKIKAKALRFHLESNGDLVKDKHTLDWLGYRFHYLAFSPKQSEVAMLLHTMICDEWWRIPCYSDIKVVTDLDRVGIDMLRYATMLMPLTTKDEIHNQEIRRKVWSYCCEHKLKYSARLHYELWGKERKR